MPDYLKNDWRENRWRRVVRFRLGNEVMGSRYWEDKEKQFAGYVGETETWEHVWERYRMDIGREEAKVIVIARKAITKFK